MREIRRMVDYKPVYKTMYIADDGNEFATEEECREYEKVIPQIDQYHIEDWDGLRPIDIDGSTSDCSDYIWYRVTTKDEVSALERYYRLHPGQINVPQLVCIEASPNTPKRGYPYTESELKLDTEAFWEKLGYKVTFTPKDTTE